MKSDKLEEATIQMLSEQKQLLYEMSSITTRESGLKTKLNLIQNGANRGYQHWARVKVTLSNKQLFPIEVNENGEVKPLDKDGVYTKLDKTDKDIVNDAIPYIKEHIDIIMAYWKGLFEEDDLHDILNNRITLQDAINRNTNK